MGMISEKFLQTYLEWTGQNHGVNRLIFTQRKNLKKYYCSGIGRKVIAQIKSTHPKNQVADPLMY